MMRCSLDHHHTTVFSVHRFPIINTDILNIIPDTIAPPVQPKSALSQENNNKNNNNNNNNKNNTIRIIISNNNNNNNNNNFYRDNAKPSYNIPIITQIRYLKCHDVREYKPLASPIEFRFYQRYTLNPARQSGVQFLTHYDDFRRYNIRKDFIDYFNWGKEQGQARLPHRKHRVAFDFNDKFHPTVLPRYAGAKSKFEGQDPSFNTAGNTNHKDLVPFGEFDPYSPVFSVPEHFNKRYTERRPHQADVMILKDVMPSQSASNLTIRHTDTEDEVSFGNGDLPAYVSQAGGTYQDPMSIAMTSRRVPGIHVPFRGEMDGQQMQSMSIPLTPDNLITGNDGRFSKTIYINYPDRNNILTHTLAENLSEQVDMATNGVYSKLTVLKAAQSGLTDSFCSGADLEQFAFDLGMADKYNREADILLGNSNKDEKCVIKALEKRELAARHMGRVDDAIRSQFALLWRVFTAPRPLMTFVNGRCHNFGCGLALYSKYPALRDSTEFIMDGAQYGLTPFGGITSLLARPETSLKYPGLGEFILLTGNALYAGDALRLGWSDLFTTLNDMDYYIKDWFNSTEHMHNDAVAWQLGHLLEKCFRMKDQHNTALERCAITPMRARWIEDAFADQSSVESIIITLTMMERLPVSSADAALAMDNTIDLSTITPYSLPSVEEGVEKLRKNKLNFTLAPWEITEPSEPLDDIDDVMASGQLKSNLAEVFHAYEFGETEGGKGIITNKARKKIKAWRDQRYREYQEHMEMLNRPIKRHVFARIEGADGNLIDFEHMFDAFGASASHCTPDASNGYVQDAMVKTLKTKIAQVAGYDPARPLELAWYLPTLDTAKVCSDEDLLSILHNDTGLEAPDVHPTTFPPLYFLVKRPTIYLSEWAYAVKHQLLLTSPFALKATFQMLREVRTSGKMASRAVDMEVHRGGNENSDLAAAEKGIQSVSETLDTEYRYLSRMLRRGDFYHVGFHSNKTMQQWEELEDERALLLNKSDSPQNQPDNITYDDIYERNVTINGHKFLLRPKWHPRTLEEVNDAEIAELSNPLTYQKDNGLTEIHVPTLTNKKHTIAAAVNDMGGLEIVPGLGELMSSMAGVGKTNEGTSGTPKKSYKVPPLVSNAYVPDNISFYEMARHPWMDTPNSWRTEDHTEASKAYMEDKYRHAMQVYDSDQEGGKTHQYWASKASVEGNNTFEREEQTLLKDRLYDVLEDASKTVDSWARPLRKAAEAAALPYTLEVATHEERFGDDDYYRWFIYPGEHPNPSGLIRDGRKVPSPSESSDNSKKSAIEIMKGFNSDEDENMSSLSIDGEEEVVVSHPVGRVELDDVAE